MENMQFSETNCHAMHIFKNSQCLHARCGEEFNHQFGNYF